MQNAMPPLETMNKDEAFLNLLSSQRGLLTQLNMEAAMRGRGQKIQAGHPPAKKRGSMLGLDPAFLMNQPLIVRRASMDLVFSSRLSLDMIGNDNYMIPNMDADDANNLKIDPDMEGRTMKRRRSSLGLLSSLFFDEASKQSRRISLVSLSRHVEGSDDKFEHEVLSFEHVEPPMKLAPKFNPNFSQEIVKSTLEAFATSMEKSTKTQQDIHDWDKKMGLKRSHSKTMRLSMRSRKKLRGILKKEINALVSSR
jgi:hypothetical protein